MLTTMTECKLWDINNDDVEWSGQAIYFINLDAYDGKITEADIETHGIPTGAHYLILIEKADQEIN